MSYASKQFLIMFGLIGWHFAGTVALANGQISPSNLNFNGGWRLHVGDEKGAEAADFKDADWQAVTLPHAFNEDDAFRVSIDKLSTGIAWYRKTFTLPPEVKDSKVFLEFQGVRQAGKVWVNGNQVGLSENGVMAFGVDITDAIKPGENVVAVRCDNSWGYKEEKSRSGFQWNDKNFYANYGGINKNVILHIKPRLYQTLQLFSNLGTTGIYVYGKDLDVPGRTATVVAESEVANDTTAAQQVAYDVTVLDLDGKKVAHFGSPAVAIKPGTKATLTASGKLQNVNFWSWGYGYLYTVRTALKVDGKVVDSVDTKTGFRKTEFTGGALKLNGRTLQVHGYAQRSTNEWPALGIDVPPWLSDFSNRLAVESGGNLFRWMHVTPSKQDVESCDRVGLLQAMPAGDSEGDPSGRRWEQRVELMRDAIIYNRNNPSIIFYECGNKGISDEHVTEMLDLKKKYDPHGGRAMGSREEMGSGIAEYGGEMLYINKSAGKPMWAMEYMRDEALRKNLDQLTPPFHKDGEGEGAGPSYNRNQDSYTVEAVKRWFDYWHERPGTGKRVSGGGVNIHFSDSNTHHRGVENYRRSGEVDPMRLPKDAFYAHQVMWNGWVDVEKPAAHIVGHWNYEAGTTKDVYIVSSAEKVELFKNGQSLGFGNRSYEFLFTFEKVSFEPGALKAVGYDAAGKQVCSTEIRTAGKPVAIKLTPHTSPTGFVADGSDLALVDVEVVDDQGQRCPTAMNTIDFELDGPAEWRGGIAQGPDNCILARSLPVELGVNRVIVRSQTKAGTITLKATAEGLKPATLSLETKAADPARLLGADLAPSLARGPTPAGDSIHVTRIPLQIASVKAGSDEEDAGKTLDDNETTGWGSTGSLKDAWIKYELASPAIVSEITMKVGSWKSRSYPIRVTVDDKEAYVGGTPRSLGYVTIPLKPMWGNTVTIQLTGPSSEHDDFDMTEVTGKKLAEGTDRAEKSVGKNNLRLHEVELYGPVKP
jgi:beta-galactosidase